MPNYDYRCEKCEQVFEVFQKMSDNKLTTCIKDGCSGVVKRLLGAGAGVIFKGSGFYETDNRSKSYNDGASKEKPAPKEKPAKKKVSE
ncbi:MAG: zinc ribbon domain-containing protein [Rubritalea sp.]|jgi:putative FmdB family regulatory protein|tara:strand:+ start:13888 stop:14151 length:264 start_codon:yes stop_codon:yes gene_type:complete